MDNEFAVKSEISKVPNKNDESDISHALRYTRLLLKSLGMWPMIEKRPRSELWLSEVLLALCFILMCFTIIPSSFHIIFKEKNTIVRLTLFGPVAFCLTNFLKYYLMIMRRNSIRFCIDHVKTDWRMLVSDEDRAIMTRNVNSARGLTAICGIFMYTGGMSYHVIMPFLSGGKKNQLNQTARPLVYSGYDIFVDSQSTPTYEIIFFTHCICAMVMYNVTTAACNLAATFVAHTCGQMQITMSRLDTLFDSLEVKNYTVEDRMRFVIRSHVRVLRLASRVEEVLREICLVEVVASTLTICLLEYYCMTEWRNSETVAIMTYFMLLVSLSFNIFIFCHIGELLKEQCSQFGNATYMIDWYRLPGRIGLALVMIIAMSNCTRKITAGRMMELSISSFGAIIKTSFVYLNMLQTVTT